MVQKISDIGAVHVCNQPFVELVALRLHCGIGYPRHSSLPFALFEERSNLGNKRFPFGGNLLAMYLIWRSISSVAARSSFFHPLAAGLSGSFLRLSMCLAT